MRVIYKYYLFSSLDPRDYNFFSSLSCGRFQHIQDIEEKTLKEFIHQLNEESFFYSGIHN